MLARIINTGKGWFDGAPRNLRPLHFRQYSDNIVRLLGMRKIADDIHESIEQSLECSNEIDCIHSKLQWALGLVDNVLYSSQDFPATQLESKFLPRALTRDEFVKAKIFILTQMAHVQSNPTARNWYLNDAMLLDIWLQNSFHS